MTQPIVHRFKWERAAAFLAAVLLLILSSALALPAFAAAGPYYISEVLANPPGTDSPYEYVELRGPASGALPAGTYFVGIEGDSSGAGVGVVQTLFDLSGKTFGSNGYMVLRQFNSTIPTHPDAAVYTSTATGWSGGLNFSAESGTDIENPSVTFFLINAAAAPVIGSDIDANGDGTPDGAVYPTWTIYDGISVLDSGATDAAYAPLAFVGGAANGLVPAGTVKVSAGWNAQYVARIGTSTGDTADDWFASDSLAGTAPNFITNSIKTTPLAYANVALNHAGTVNPELSNNPPMVIGLTDGISATLGDTTQPGFTGAGFGFDFAVSDDATAADSITVTVANGTPDVLSSATVVDTGVGTWRLDIGAPAGLVGISTVTVAASDGAVTSNFYFKYGVAADDVDTANERWHTGSAEASTAIALDADFMVVADDEDQTLRTYSRVNSGLPVALTNVTSFLGLTDASGSGALREVDIEGSTRAGNRLYFMGSHSHSSGGNLRVNRNRLFAVDVTGTGASTAFSYVGRYGTGVRESGNLKADLIAWDNANGHGLGAAALGLQLAGRTVDEGGVIPENGGYNMEGLSFRPNSTTDALIGFRSPLVSNKAIVVGVQNLPGLVSADPATGPATFDTLYLLDLGGRGVRSIECNASECLILAGSPGATRDFKLFTWVPGSAPVERAADITGGTLNPEAIVEVPASFTAASSIQLLSDNGDDVVYADGEPSGDHDQVNLRRFRSDRFDLGAVVLPTAVINEFSLNHTGIDTNEYIEVLSAPNANLSGFTLLQIEGDSPSQGMLDVAIPLTTADANGYWWTGTINNVYENGSITLMLVYGFTGATGTDLDTNNDGVLDSTPWATLVDSVGLNDNVAGGDKSYGQVELLPNYDGVSTFIPGGASRIPNGTDTNTAADWVRNDFDLAGIPGFTGTLIAGEALNTPNAVNATSPVDVAPTVASTLPLDNATDVAVDANITITFSEPVTVTDPWASVVCATSGTVATSISGGPTSYTLDPAANLATNENCVVTVTAANVADQDGTPTAMAADYTFDFTTVGGPVCSTPFTAIYTLQEGGANFGAAGTFTVEGIVTADFQAADQLGGFYLQDAVGDANAATSDGLFVVAAPALLDVTVGQRVRATGTVTEFRPVVNGTASTVGQTRMTASAVTSCGDTGTITPALVTLPFASSDVPERYENMLVTMTQTLYAGETFVLGRYGETTLSSGSRLINPTNVVEPGPLAQALQAANNLNRVKLDDGRDGQNPDPTPYLFGAEMTLRTGDTTNLVTGIFTHTDSSAGSTSDAVAYRVHPTAAVTFTRANPRPTAPAPAGSLRVISFNVLNYFNGNGAGGGFPTSRGADSSAEFLRQSDKIVAAITALNPDVAGLIELENDSGTSGAQAELVNRLNAVAGAGTYAYVETGVIGTDEIKVAFIYKPAVVSPVGAALVDLDAVHNRPPVAQVFQQVSNGARFTAVVNHFKSKGCGDATGLNTDQGDGQGCYNLQRTQQAQRLASWLATVVFPATGEPDVMVIGDLNAYNLEDPIDALTSAGYGNQLTRFDANAYGYVFNGQAGSLDHALATSPLAAQIVAATDWHINSDEPSVLDYNVEFKSDAQDALNVGTAFRSSDHDPVVIDLNLVAPLVTPTPIAPIGTTADTTPTFEFSKVAGAEFYYLWLSSGPNKIVDQWIDAGSACGEATCTYTLPTALADQGVYAWFIQAYSGAAGYSPWSAETTFTLAITPVTPTVVSPLGEISQVNPAFTFNAVEGATNYHVWLSRTSGADQGYVKDMFVNAADVCSAGVCAVNLNVTLTRGAYGWWVQAYNPFGGFSPWTERNDFQVILPLAGAPTPVAPIGAITDTSPTFTFSRVAGANWYYLWLSSGPNKILDQWMMASAICTTETLCEVTPGLNLPAGNYSWFIQAWDEYAGYTPWSAETPFVIALAPLNPVQVSPVGTISTLNPVYTWQRSNGATYYALWVSSSTGYVLDRWVAAETVCVGDTCSLNPGVALVQNRSYRWWVQAWNPYGGFSLWTGPMVFQTSSGAVPPVGIEQPDAIGVTPLPLDGAEGTGFDAVLPDPEATVGE